jgi:hypothetical protein
MQASNSGGAKKEAATPPKILRKTYGCIYNTRRGTPPYPSPGGSKGPFKINQMSSCYAG